MLICPICNTEYRKGASVCKLCGVQLQEQVPRFVEEDSTCPDCGAEVSAQGQFCLHCGSLKNINFVTPCQNHRDRASIGACVLCQKELCKDCTSERNRRIRCEEHLDVEIVEEWAEVFHSNDSMEVSFVREVLDSEGVPSHPYDKGSSHFFVPLVSDTALSR